MAEDWLGVRLTGCSSRFHQCLDCFLLVTCKSRIIPFAFPWAHQATGGAASAAPHAPFFRLAAPPDFLLAAAATLSLSVFSSPAPFLFSLSLYSSPLVSLPQMQPHHSLVDGAPLALTYLPVALVTLPPFPTSYQIILGGGYPYLTPPPCHMPHTHPCPTPFKSHSHLDPGEWDDCVLFSLFPWSTWRRAHPSVSLSLCLSWRFTQKGCLCFCTTTGPPHPHTHPPSSTPSSSSDRGRSNTSRRKQWTTSQSARLHFVSPATPTPLLPRRAPPTSWLDPRSRSLAHISKKTHHTPRRPPSRLPSFKFVRVGA